jgi:hypothetical protein
VVALGDGNEHLNGWIRATLYLGGAVAAMVGAFFLGMAHYESTECSGPRFGGECDLAGLEGLRWAFFATIVVLVVVVAIEIAIRRRRRRTRAAQ